MKQWRLTYELLNQFSSPVNHHSFSLRCFPRDMERQKTEACECEILPGAIYSRGRDSFGNPMIIGCSEEAHDIFAVRVRALVMTTDQAEPETKPEYQIGMYRYFTPTTRPGETLRKFYESVPAAGQKTVWERTQELMECFCSVYQYESGSTSFFTTAEEAFSQGKGVCQDYAHILLALCRMEGMIARYAAGTIPGEGESHAWIEVYQDGFWKGFDPTHCKPADEDYIVFAVGRDAHDCSISRGIFKGWAGQSQQVRVTMEEYET